MPLIGRKFSERSTAVAATAGQRLSAVFGSERERWALWLPVCLGLGIGIYFSLAVEPPIWLGLVAVFVIGPFGFAVRQRPALAVGVLGIGCVAIGFTVAQWRTLAVHAPMLQTRLGPVGIAGRVIAVEPRPKGLRVTLEDLAIERLEKERTPARVRINLNGRQPALQPADHVRLRAILSPPPPPAAPGAFDFQRQSYFRRLGGVGFSLGKAELDGANGDRAQGGFWLGVARIRQSIGQKITAQIDGSAGAVAVALMTGTRKFVWKQRGFPQSRIRPAQIAS